jgi:hypothetical protein
VPAKPPRAIAERLLAPITLARGSRRFTRAQAKISLAVTAIAAAGRLVTRSRAQIT